MTVSFLIFAVLTVAGMAAAMGLRNAVHCVLALTAGFAGVAALYLQLGAQFVGLAQIMVYVGAVAILAVFAIMMTHSPEPAEAALPSLPNGLRAASLPLPSSRYLPGQSVPARHSREVCRRNLTSQFSGSAMR